MQGKIYEIPLDISSGVLTSQIRELVTEDMGTNTFRFKVVSDNHKPYDFTNTTVRMMVKTPSGARIQQECTIENAVGGTVSLTLKQSLLLEHGSYVAELQIYDAITQSIRLTTPTFTYHVRQSLQNSESIVATDEYTILQEALADLAGINIVVANKADKDYVDTLIGDIEELETDDATNLTNAINEVKSQSNENVTQVTNHKDEIISHSLTVTRDLSISGSQIIGELPFTPKSIVAIAGINGVQGKTSFGFRGQNGSQYSLANLPNSNTLLNTYGAITIGNDASNRTAASITVQNKQLTINWSHAGTGATGVVSVFLLLQGHGGA